MTDQQALLLRAADMLATAADLFKQAANAASPADAVDLLSGDWLTLGEAAFEARCSQSTMRRRIRNEPEGFAVSSGGRFYVNKRRLCLSTASTAE